MLNHAFNNQIVEPRLRRDEDSFDRVNSEAGETTTTLGVKCRVSALRILTATVLKQMESIESRSEPQFEIDLPSLVREFEAQLIRNVLEMTGGHQRRAARILGLKANTLNNKMRRHDIVDLGNDDKVKLAESDRDIKFTIN